MSTPETCSGAMYHGNPYRYCPVKDCGWIEPEPEQECPADEGHRFTISFTSRGSSKVVGETHHTDSELESEPWAVTVRAWNLRDALVKASAVPLAVWAGDRSADDE